MNDRGSKAADVLSEVCQWLNVPLICFLSVLSSRLWQCFHLRWVLSWRTQSYTGNIWEFGMSWHFPVVFPDVMENFNPKGREPEQSHGKHFYSWPLCYKADFQSIQVHRKCTAINSGRVIFHFIWVIERFHTNHSLCAIGRPPEQWCPLGAHDF